MPSITQSSEANFRAAQSAPTAQEPYAAGRLVLVVEDDDDMRFMLNVMLEMNRFRVAEARDGLEAIEIAERIKPDLILMDGSLPKLDGLDATRRIRQISSLQTVPIIALTGHAESDFRNAALIAGCNDCLVKPVDFTLMVNLLNDLA